MKYRMVNILIFKGKNSRGQFSYAQSDLKLEDPRLRQSRTPRFYMLDDDTTKLYEPYAEAVTDAAILNQYRVGKIEQVLKVNEVSLQKAIDEGKCIDLLHIDNIVRYTYELDEPWAPIYNRDTVVNGITYKAGDFRRGDNGEIVPVKALILYIARYFDPDTNTWEYLDPPEEVAHRILERGYKRYTTTPPTVAVEATVNGAEPATTDPTASLTQEQKDELLKKAMAAMS